MPKTKFFFATGSNGKDVSISSAIDARRQNCERALIDDLNDFLKDIYEQALSEFPKWLEKWGCRANESNPLLNLDEIREEWKYKKGQFGVYRMVSQAGFFTDCRPQNAERLEIINLEIINATSTLYRYIQTKPAVIPI
jgi:hypothetical protein